MCSESITSELLGTGNHFIEVCLDENENGWFLLHSGSRGVAVGQGWVNGKSDGQFWVTRVLADGSAYDSTFGINGLTEANFNMATGGPTSVALDPGGKIVVTGGGLYSGNKNFTTSRFLGDSSSPSIALPASAVPSGATISAPNAILGALVLNDPTFLDSLPSGKHRRLN